MSQASDRSPPARGGLRVIHGLIAFTAMGIGLPLAIVGGMSMLGALTENLWIRAIVPVVVLLAAPLLLADRLLPKEPGKRRPGLVRDVLASSWAATAIAFVGLAGSLTAAPLRAEAARLDDDGWTRAAWIGRWMAGPEDVDEAGAGAGAEPGSEAEADAEPEPTTELASATVHALTQPDPGLTAPAEQVDSASEAIAPSSDDAEPGSAGEPKEVQDASPREYSPAELFSTYAPAVVSIKIEHGGFRSGGTGFFIDDRGTIATNHHVVEGAREVRVKLFDGTELDRVELLASDAEVDLALLRIDPASLAEALVPTWLGDSEAVEVGEPVSVIGNPLGLDHTLTNGIVSARRIYEGERYIQMSAPISPGNSGGPVFDRHGRVIGVSVAQMIGGQNLNLAVPVSQLQDLVADEYPNRRSFGASSW